MNQRHFQKIVLKFYREHRRDFPWRPPALRIRKDGSLDPYRVLVSEIMLQQTQANHVASKFKEFVKRFPTFGLLAKASITDVLKVWQGLGYNRRALSLKKLSQIVTEGYRGKLPKDHGLLQKFPGVGQYTAGAVMAFAWNTPFPCIETNIRRVYIHHFFPGRENVSDSDLAPLIEKTLDRKNPRDWYYALMDYGAELRRTHRNPNQRSKHYTVQSKFGGSNRQLRGQILRLLLEGKRSTVTSLKQKLDQPILKIKTILKSLEYEGFIRAQRDLISLA